ncbi:MAG: helix-turn-helix domain-containing protein [Pseudomonadota bacterium]
MEDAQRLPLRILQAGWEVLAEHGFEGFTFDRIARHARIGKVTIYNRFPSKREFLEALLKHNVEERRVSIMSKGVGLSLVESFCQRAATAVEILLSPDGVLMERLVDWCDQEFGDAQVNYRHAMFAHALADVEFELRIGAEKEGVKIADMALAARFWLEGILGHARMTGTTCAFDRDETERWARSYSEFYFAGICA